VAEIAGEVGYESEAAFNRAFKREFGEPPGRYRMKHKRVFSKSADVTARQADQIANSSVHLSAAARFGISS
jgi:AraC-like DNA-binding protein